MFVRIKIQAIPKKPSANALYILLNVEEEVDVWLNNSVTMITIGGTPIATHNRVFRGTVFGYNGLLSLASKQ